MAKTKIFELAKELGIQSRDIITFLQKEGVEAKAAQSSIEDETVRTVRKHFGKSEGEKRIVTEGEMRMGDMPEKKEAQKEIQREAHASQTQGSERAGPGSERACEEEKEHHFCEQPAQQQDAVPERTAGRQTGGRQRKARIRKRRRRPSGSLPVRQQERSTFRSWPGT